VLDAVSITPVPEPSALLLAGGGGLAALLRARWTRWGGNSCSNRRITV
jgi:hypothetical protein